MIWNGKDLKTIGDLMSAMSHLSSREEAARFMELYRADNPLHADQNIGYLTGYFDRGTADRLMEWCGVSHPIFGKNHPSPEEAFSAGMLMAKDKRNPQ